VELVAKITTLIIGQPTYDYRRIHARLRHQRREQGGASVNVKQVLSGDEIGAIPARSQSGAPDQRVGVFKSIGLSFEYFMGFL
jgi:hypothetical protein